jgi:hypothetical protein
MADITKKMETTMITTLCIPRPAFRTETGQEIKSNAVYRFRLRWTDHHPAAHFGAGVLLDFKSEVIDGFMFRHLRDTVGAWLETDDAPRIASALGVPDDEPVIKQK